MTGKLDQGFINFISNGMLNVQNGPHAGDRSLCISGASENTQSGGQIPLMFTLILPEP